MSNKYRFDKIIPYLLGFSHNYSSKIMGVSVDQSKKIFMDFKTFYGFFNRDDWLYYAMISDILFCLHDFLTSSINID